ncbi:Fic family protein [Gryllotalpicola reticulitermitis]|uniref:Fic family protein n=1 Tax=Gryllotalpicola reticulitermitis TaxID=1184153 RepID=A0ABV8Q6N0_9MICO
MEAAAAAVAGLEADAGPGSGAISSFLIRTESISSSKIEHVEASTDDFARAIAGIRANESATSMVAASRAVGKMINDAGKAGLITLDSMLAAHHTLMKDDPHDQAFAGKVRDQQNWILGSDYSPIGAVHVPPVPERVGELLEDLIEFSNRDDIPAIAQAAIAHAQFESIHPFTDGNGRIGRALIGAILRRRGLTVTTTPPIASALVAKQQDYFDMVNRYRDGYLDPFIQSMARSTQIASQEARVSVTRIRELPTEWAETVRPRSGSAAHTLLSVLLDHPVISAQEAEDLGHAATSSTYAALDRLEEAGVVHQITNRQRNRVWAVSAITSELDDLTARIARRARE